MRMTIGFLLCLLLFPPLFSGGGASLVWADDDDDEDRDEDRKKGKRKRRREELPPPPVIEPSPEPAPPPAPELSPSPSPSAAPPPPSSPEVVATRDFTNRPNPFEAGVEETLLLYRLEAPAHVVLRIYNLLGDLVWEREFLPGESGGSAGTNSVPWQGKNNDGEIIGNGGYIAQIVVDGREAGKRKIAVEK